MPAEVAPIELPIKRKGSIRDPFNTVESRRTEEIVIAFSGPAGSGTSTVAKKAQDLLERYDYKVNYLKVSDLIINAAKSLLPDFYEQLNSLGKADKAKKKSFTSRYRKRNKNAV